MVKTKIHPKTIPKPSQFGGLVERLVIFEETLKEDLDELKNQIEERVQELGNNYDPKDSILVIYRSELSQHETAYNWYKELFSEMLKLRPYFKK